MVVAVNVLIMTVQSDIEGFILVGGASTRMGEDKAQLKLGHQTFVERIKRALEPVVKRTTLIASKTQDSPMNLPVATDVFNGWGAFGGLHAALTACRSEWAIVVACDLPMVTTALFDRIISFRGGCDAVAPIQSDGVPQPLCALYRVDPCCGCAERLIASGERRPRSLLSEVRTRWVTMDELVDLEGAEYFFSNINTPIDYAQIQQRVKGAQRSGSGG